MSGESTASYAMSRDLTFCSWDYRASEAEAEPIVIDCIVPNEKEKT